MLIDRVTQLITQFLTVSFRPQRPSVTLTLTPQWSERGASITSIAAQMVVLNREFAPRQPMMEMVSSFFGQVPSMNYTGSEALRAHDDAGPLSLFYEDDLETSIRQWSPQRTTVGEMSIHFEVFPRNVDKTTQPGARYDFRSNSGGLIGSGNVFVPTLLEDGNVRRRIDPKGYKIKVVWNLAQCPEGTKAVWAYGEGTRVTIDGNPSDLVNTLYAVSPTLHSYTDPLYPRYGVYWLTTPPESLIPNMTVLASQVIETFKTFESFFRNPGPGLKVFFRETPRGYGGTGLMWSLVVEWDRGLWLGEGDQSRRDLYSLLSHEILHLWPGMKGGRGGDGIDPDTIWYEEGIATYYGAVLPFSLGLINPEQFLAEFNTKIFSAYYTSPAINMSALESSEKAWSDTNAQRLPYSRGALYLLHIDAAIQQSSSGRYSLRDPVLRLLQLQRSGHPYGMSQWNHIIREYLGDFGERLFTNMSSGSWVIPPPEAAEGYSLFGRSDVALRLVYEEQRRYQLGFNRSLENGNTTVVRKVIKGSEAEKAGIRDGDVITWSTYNLESSMDDPEAFVLLSLRRPSEGGILGDDFEVEYLPRENVRVPAWKYEGI